MESLSLYGDYDVFTVYETPADFIWVKWAEQAVSAGTHTITIAWKEDAACIDKLLIRTY